MVVNGSKPLVSVFLISLQLLDDLSEPAILQVKPLLQLPQGVPVGLHLYLLGHPIHSLVEESIHAAHLGLHPLEKN